MKEGTPSCFSHSIISYRLLSLFLSFFRFIFLMGTISSSQNWKFALAFIRVLHWLHSPLLLTWPPQCPRFLLTSQSHWLGWLDHHTSKSLHLHLHARVCTSIFPSIFVIVHTRVFLGCLVNQRPERFAIYREILIEWKCSCMPIRTARCFKLRCIIIIDPLGSWASLSCH